MHTTKCAHCGRTATTRRPATYCNDSCRSKARHARDAERLRAPHAAAAAHAEAALRSGDIATLEAAARRTISLLTPAD